MSYARAIGEFLEKVYNTTRNGYTSALDYLSPVQFESTLAAGAAAQDERLSA